jgi:hypothetical protein
MKHLKDRKVFEDKSQTEKDTELIIPDLKDICLELDDEGFDISFSYHETSGNPYTATYVYHVCISKNKTLYVYNDQVKEVCERIKDYLGDNFIEIYVRPIVGEYYKGNKIPEIMDGRGVTSIKLYFTI